MASASSARSTASKSTSSKSTPIIPQLEWRHVRPAPVILVSGTEGFLADRALRLLRDTLRAEDPSLEVNDLEADGYVPGELLTLASPSLFNDPRLIRVTNVEKCTDAFLSLIHIWRGRGLRDRGS